MRPLKVLHIIPNLNKGGAELLLLNVCRGVHQRWGSIDFRVLTILEKGGLLKDFESSNIPVSILPFPSSPSPIKLIQTFYIMRKIRPDAVHVHLYVSERYGLLAALFAGIRIRIATLHNVKPSLSLSERISVLITSRLATHIIAVSETAQEFWVASRGFDRSRMRVIHNAPMSIAKKSLPVVNFPTPGETLRMVNIGRIHPIKGQLFLIRALALLAKAGVRADLDIYGDSPEGYDRVLIDEARSLGVEKALRFKGYCADIGAVLERYHLMVNPSLSEGFGMVNVEALHAGLPAVVSDIPTHREIYRDHDPVIFCPLSDPTALARAIIRISSDPDLFSGLARKSKDRAKDFTLDKMFDNYISFYKEIAGRASL